MLYEHQGLVSTSSTLMQVSNVPPPNSNGKVQTSQPLYGGYVAVSVVGDQIARNPENERTSLDENLIVIRCDSVMMLQGLVISPQ